MQIAKDRSGTSVSAVKPTPLPAMFLEFHALMVACRDEAWPKEAASDKLADWLLARIETAAHDGNAAHASVARAAFALAALADRWLSWPDPNDAKLTERLFGAQATTQLLFSHIDDLLRQAEAADRQMASLYLAVLNLGFVNQHVGQHGGRHSVDSERAAARERRSQLHRLVRDGLDPAGQVSPGARGRTAEIPVLQPATEVWHALAVAGAAAFLIASHIVWTSATDGIGRQVEAARAILEDQGISWSE